jgi:hypothetical protein
MRIYSALEIQDAIPAAQVGTTHNILKPICILCRRFLSKRDARTGQAVCWRCGTYFP